MPLSKEFKVGLFVFAGFVLVLAAVIVTARINIARRGYTLDVRFSSAADLREGAMVVLAGGIKVGYIRSITLVSNQVNVRCWIDNRHRIDRKALFIITSAGLMGSKFLNIEVPTPSGRYFEPGDVAQGVNPLSFDMLSIKVGNALNSLFGEALATEEMRKSFVASLQNIGELLFTLNQMVQQNERNVTASLNRIARTTDLVSRNLDTILASLNYTVRTAEGLSREQSGRVKQAIVQLEESSREFKTAAANLKHMTEAVRNQQGTLGKLVYDRALYDSLLRTSQNLEEVTARLKKSGSLIKF